MTEDERAERLRRLAERRAASGRAPAPDGPGSTDAPDPARPAATTPSGGRGGAAGRRRPAAGARAVAAGAGASLLMGLIGWMAGYDAGGRAVAAAPPQVVVVERTAAATPGATADAPVMTTVEPRTVTVNAAPAPVRTHASR